MQIVLLKKFVVKEMQKGMSDQDATI